MRASVRALLESVLDYAGLFPPAKLDMANTVRNYGAYLNSDYGWMLGRLIVPVARLAEFEHHATDLLPRGGDDDVEPWLISALTAPADESEQLAADLATINSFNARHGDRNNGLAMIDIIELRAGTAHALSDALDQIPPELFPYFELSLDNDPRGMIAALVEGDAGAKVRTGGVTADAYPAPHDLAQFIAACALAAPGGVPFKATAGLHHPLRHHSEAVKCEEFGFFNVFIAGCMAQIEAPEIDDLIALLTERSAEAFTFEDDSVTWREYRLSTDEIEEARDGFAVSFGSCSFDEPVEDLRAMQLL